MSKALTSWFKSRLPGGDRAAQPGHTLASVHLPPSTLPAVMYPDAATPLAAPDDTAVGDDAAMPWEVEAFVLAARAQVAAQLAVLRSVIKGVTMKASASTHEADARTREHHRSVASVEAARDIADRVFDLLHPFTRHSGRIWKVKYWVLYACFFFGDIASGTLALVLAGKPVAFGLLLSISLAAGTVGMAAIGEYARDRSLWNKFKDTIPDEKRDPDRVVRSVFILEDAAWKSDVKTRILVGLGVAGIGTGIALLTINKDALGAIGFGLWGMAIFAGSYINAYTHCDPAATHIESTQKQVAKLQKVADKVDLKPVRLRAGNLRHTAETIEEHAALAQTLWNTKLQEAAHFLAQNPRLFGHYPKAMSVLLSLDSNVPELFTPLADRYQIPVYLHNRDLDGPVEYDAEKFMSHSADTDDDADVIDIGIINVRDDVDTCFDDEGDDGETDMGETGS